MEADMTDDLEPHRLDLRSADIVAPRVEALASLFPEAVSDGKVDLDALARLLGDVTDGGPERFGLTWPGKAEAIRLAQRASEGTLVPSRDQSVDWDNTENIIIEGDNLEVLKLLQRSYHGKAKLIYIDPPFNTGRDFVYPDNFRDPLGEYLRFSGQVGSDGGRVRANAETSGRYHSSWLSMMWPRLHLARSLLADEGVLVVSIDDTELPRLRSVLDEIFGEENFIATIIWQKVYSPKNTAKHFSVDHDYLVVYARSAELWEPQALARTAEMEARYRNPDGDPRGPWKPADLSARNYYSQGTYPIVTPSGRTIDGPPPGTYWRFSQTRFHELDADGRIWWGLDGSNVPAIKRFLSEVKAGRTPQTLWPYGDVGHTQDAKKQLLKMVSFASSDSVFDTPKPVGLMRRLLELTTTPDTPDLVIDFFAGSGTMGEAVLRLNDEDGGRRRFILVQLDEPLDDRLHPTITDVTRARVKAADEELASARGPRGPHGGGFRAYRLTTSARRATEPHTDEDGQISFDPAPALDPTRDDASLLTEVLLSRGFDLVTPTEWRDVGGVDVALVADGALVACFARSLTVEQFEALVALDPAQLVLLEAAFGGDDQVKINSLQHLKTVNAHRDTSIELLVL
jgi:adenine-specific DNA-methyltransferase